METDLLPKYASIGVRFRHVREITKLSQGKFAEKLGVKTSIISEIERGNVKPTLVLLIAMEYVYRVRKEWVLQGDPPMYRSDESILGPISITPPEDSSSRQIRFYINKLIRIFEEGNKNKIEALKAQLRALDPGPTKKQ